MHRNPLLPKEFRANGAIAKFRIVKFDAADGDVVQAAAATDKLLGIAEHAAASGERVRVNLVGIAEVEAGGAITRGNLLTSDANGKALSAAPASGVNNRIVGKALVSAASGDIFPALLLQSGFQGQ